MDTLVYPIVFNYRHYIELLLKKCLIETVNELGDEFTDDESSVYFYQHDLNLLFELFSLRAEQLFQMGDNYKGLEKGFRRCFESVKNLVESLHLLDPKSFTFRYWKNKRCLLHFKPDEELESFPDTVRLNVFGLNESVNTSIEDLQMYLIILRSIKDFHIELEESI